MGFLDELVGFILGQPPKTVPPVYRNTMENADGQRVERFIPTELGYRDVPMPGTNCFMIHQEAQATALDQFYFMVVYSCITPNPKVGFRNEKIKLNPDDSQKLYDILLSQCRKFYHVKKAEEVANDIWEKLAPASDANVPIGKVRLMDGYIRLI